VHLEALQEHHGAVFNLDPLDHVALEQREARRGANHATGARLPTKLRQ
jgi:hypothetical protein